MDRAAEAGRPGRAGHRLAGDHRRLRRRARRALVVRRQGPGGGDSRPGRHHGGQGDARRLRAGRPRPQPGRPGGPSRPAYEREHQAMGRPPRRRQAGDEPRRPARTPLLGPGSLATRAGRRAGSSIASTWTGSSSSRPICSASPPQGVRRAGVLVYAVRSLARDETTGQVERFLAEQPDFRLDPFPDPLDGVADRRNACHLAGSGRLRGGVHRPDDPGRSIRGRAAQRTEEAGHAA